VLLALGERSVRAAEGRQTKLAILFMGGSLPTWGWFRHWPGSRSVPQVWPNRTAKGNSSGMHLPWVCALCCRLRQVQSAHRQVEILRAMFASSPDERVSYGIAILPPGTRTLSVAGPSR
jgi:hypothetical protein